jgi:hypothetical protein
MKKETDLLQEEIKKVLNEYIGARVEDVDQQEIKSKIVGKIEDLQKSKQIKTFHPQVSVFINGPIVDVSFPYDLGIFQFSLFPNSVE